MLPIEIYKVHDIFCNHIKVTTCYYIIILEKLYDFYPTKALWKVLIDRKTIKNLYNILGECLIEKKRFLLDICSTKMDILQFLFFFSFVFPFRIGTLKWYSRSSSIKVSFILFIYWQGNYFWCCLHLTPIYGAFCIPIHKN